MPSQSQLSAPAEVIVPLDQSRADFEDLYTEALHALDYLAERGLENARQVVAELVRAPGDELRFRKETATIRGAIAWPAGEELVASSRGILTAGAKARLSRRAYFGQTHGRFANRFLDSVLMGQTMEGSYVVTAYAEPDQQFPEKDTDQPLPSLARYSGRDVVESIATSIETVREAVDHYQRTNSLSGFVDNVRFGVSREMTAALESLVSDAEAAEVAISYAPAAQLFESSRPQQESVEFSGSDASVLGKASIALAVAEPAEFVRASGWVSLVAKPKRNAAGVIRLIVLGGSTARTLQVRVSDEQFEIGADAIAHDKALMVSGRQEKEGNRHWLYDVEDLQLLDVPDDDEAAQARQPTIFDFT